MIKVTVITPLYNSEQFISGAISSVQAQKMSHWEMIVVDDCSTDKCPEIVNSFVEVDSRIKLFRLNDNSGPAVARNFAIKAASGRFIAFLDSDDQWLPDKLEKQIDFMIKNDYAFTYTGYEKITESGEKTGNKVCPASRVAYGDLLKSNQIGCLTAIYDTKRLGKVYMPLIRKRQDYGLWLKILKKIPAAHCLNESLALYRVRNDSVSSNKLEMVKYNWQLYRKVENLSITRSAYYLGWNIARKLRR